MFKVFAFGFEMHIKTILPLISRLINEALLASYMCKYRFFKKPTYNFLLVLNRDHSSELFSF